MSILSLVFSLCLGSVSPAQEVPAAPVPVAPVPGATVQASNGPSEDETMTAPVDQRPEGAEKTGASETSSPSAAMRRAAALAEAGKVREATQLMEN